MMNASRALVSLLAGAGLLAAACGGVSGGPRKVVFNESVCANARFLRMTLNETNRIVVDNRKYSPGQAGLGVRFEGIPVLIKGEVPQGAVIGDRVSTFHITTQAGEEKSLDVVPNFTGTYTAKCTMSFRPQTGSIQTRQTELEIQIK
ncbi:MAG: hypothetical protein HY874_04815 [Chloroflexi bacterium]|nr:hypothetical protein [Chloroflexota bacterium]